MADYNWCHAKVLDDPSSYKYKGRVPGRKPLSGKALQIDLHQLFNKYSQQSEKPQLRSSQANESLNNAKAHKALKYRHYSNSGSLKYRVSAAVAEKNDGSQYIIEVV